MLDLDVPAWDFVPDQVAKARPPQVKKLPPKPKLQKQTEPQNAQPVAAKKTGKNVMLKTEQADSKPQHQNKEHKLAQPSAGKKAGKSPSQAQRDGKQQKDDPHPAQPMGSNKAGKPQGLKKAKLDEGQPKTNAGGKKEGAAGSKRSISESQNTDVGARPKETLKDKKRRLKQMQQEQSASAAAAGQDGTSPLKPSQKPAAPAAKIASAAGKKGSDSSINGGKPETPKAATESTSPETGKKKKKKKNKKNTNKFKPQEENSAEQPQTFYSAQLQYGATAGAQAEEGTSSASKKKRKMSEGRGGGEGKPALVTAAAAANKAPTGAESMGSKQQSARASKGGSAHAAGGSAEGAKKKVKSEFPLAEAAAMKPSRSMTPLQLKMQQRLQGSHFRMLNEELYTTKSKEAQQLFKKDPSLFDSYHAGFREQTKRWPTNPVHVIIKYLKGNNKIQRIADLGCGDAQIAAELGGKKKVYSFDLVAKNERVTACDIAHVPLPDGAVHAAVLSLALMGTNYVDFLKEAHRIVEMSGQVLVAEIRSRVDGVLDEFLALLEELGFMVGKVDKDNKMFVMIYLTKVKASAARLNPPPLKACEYKRR